MSFVGPDGVEEQAFEGWGDLGAEKAPFDFRT